jgi:diketogulonate reductase-like aldo/keto reductase
VLIATKFSPDHHRPEQVSNSAKNSLRRLGTDVIDIYQIHWPNPSVPLEETIYAMTDLQEKGFIKEIGVCNFNYKQLLDAVSIADKLGTRIYANQIKFNLVDQFAYQNIKNFCNINQVKVIAYSPFKSILNGSETRKLALSKIAKEYEATEMQVALAWIISQKNVIPVPESSNINHIKEISETRNLKLTEGSKIELENVFSNLVIDLPVHKVRSRNSQRGSVLVGKKEEIEKISNQFVPSIIELATEISTGEFLQPILVRKSLSGDDIFEIIEGELRFWAYVYVNGETSTIPAIIN